MVVVRRPLECGWVSNNIGYDGGYAMNVLVFY